MYNFDPYNVLLYIATNIPAAYDWLQGPIVIFNKIKKFDTIKLS